MTVTFTPPARPKGTTERDSWAKAVTGLNDTSGGFGIDGDFLDRTGAVYTAAAGTVVLTVDTVPTGTTSGGKYGRATVTSAEATTTLYVVDPCGDNGLRQVFQRTFKSAAAETGATVRRQLAKLLAAAPEDTRLTLVTPGAPRSNRRAGECRTCGSEVRPGKGLLVGYGRDAHVTCTPGTCRRPATQDGTCKRCHQPVPAQHGEEVQEQRDGAWVWVTTHRGPCHTPIPATAASTEPHPAPAIPEEPQTGTEPATARWQVHRAQEGRYTHDRPQLWCIGQTFRTPLFGAPVPKDAPGYRIGAETAGGVPTAVATVEAIGPVRRVRDDDGDSPLPGSDCWCGTATVRLATPEEASPILEQEADEAHRVDLDRRRRALLFRDIDDATIPAPGDVNLSTATRVHFGQEEARARRVSYLPEDELYVDEDAGVVWTRTYNGADGDDWSCSNSGSYIARRLLLTPARAQLIADLRAYWDSPARVAARTHTSETVAAAAAEQGLPENTLAAYGRMFRLTTPDDLAAAATRSGEEWRGHGWSDSLGFAVRGRFTPSDAERIIEAGITRNRAEDLKSRNRNATVENIIAVPLPQIPDTPGRIIVWGRPGRGHRVTDTPEAARRFIEHNPEALPDDDPIHHTPGIRAVHVTSGWSLWDDGSLATGLWLTPPNTRLTDTPRCLTTAAEHALGLLAAATNPRDIGRPVWHPLRDATTHHRDELASSERRGAKKTLLRHTYSLADGATRHLYQVLEESWTMGEDGDYDSTSRLFTTEPAARAAYRTTRLA